MSTPSAGCRAWVMSVRPSLPVLRGTPATRERIPHSHLRTTDASDIVECWSYCAFPMALAATFDHLRGQFRSESTHSADMMTNVARPLIPMVAGAWMALVAGGLVAPGSAQAGCSHYVISMGRQGAERPSLYDLEILSESRLRGTAEPARLPNDRPLPCSGPTCSGNPGPPVAPTAPVGPMRAEGWACLALSQPPFAPPSLASCEAHVAGRPIHLAFPPDRPPRSS